MNRRHFLHLLYGTAAALALQVGQPVAHAQEGTTAKRFYITSLRSDFSVKADVAGTYELFDDRIELYVERGALVMDENRHYQERRQIKSIQFGVSLPLGGGKWNLVTRSVSLPVNTTLAPGQQFNMGSFRVAIPLNNQIDLPSGWLTLQTNLQLAPTRNDPYGSGFTYAHSNRKMFQYLRGN